MSLQTSPSSDGTGPTGIATLLLRDRVSTHVNVRWNVPVPLSFSTKKTNLTPVEVVPSSEWKALKKTLDGKSRTWTSENGFEAKLGQICKIPDEKGKIRRVLFGFGSEQTRARGRLHLARLASNLPEGDYELTGDFGDAGEAALGWLLAGYAFDRYRKSKGAVAKLKAPRDVDAKRLEIIANAAALAQDLINTPASDMGPDQLETEFRRMGKAHNATISVIKGDALLKKNFPMIHTVGRASDQAPRLLDLTWGPKSAPKVTLVGKGVCFDTGGLNIKPGNSMGLMKKDMGGAANTIALAQMIMAANLKVRLRLLVPAVENSISAGAFRPGDVLTSRKGLTVEINNTDAEGRLVLADALALADEEKPQMLFCMATLTGAARVALGPDLPPYYTDDDDMALAIDHASKAVADPLWRMPFWTPYEPMIEPNIADIDNAPAGGFAGSITAALFLKRFVENAKQFAHFDIYGWTPSAKPGRPKGGACQGARAIFEVLETKYG